MQHTTLLSRAGMIVLHLLPLCLTLTANALILQIADFFRRMAVPDDALLPPVTDYIHPASLICLILGYGLSAASVVLMVVSRRRSA